MCLETDLQTIALENQKQAENYLSQGKIEQGIACYKKVIELQPEHWGIYQKLGDIYFQQEQFSQAITIYQNAIKLNPNFPWFHHKLGEALMKLQQWEKAVSAYHQVIAIQPNFPWSYNRLGDAFMELKNWREAINAYRNFIKIKPDFPWSYNKLAKAFIKLKNWQEAVTAYRHLIELKPDLYFPYKLLGDILRQIDRLGEAISCYLKAIKLQPDATEVYEQLRGIYIYKLSEITQTQLEQLIQCYQTVIQLQPHFPEAYINLADILTEKGELDTAINYYQKATYNKLLVSHPEFVKNYWNSEQPSQPSFIIIGTVKGGTSSLYYYICHHPNVIPAVEKEINFLSRKLRKGIDWYLAHFPQLPHQGKFITGEASPNYMYFDEVGKKLLDNFPKIKIIAILRNPVDRTVSQFYMAKRLGKESKEFTEFVPQEIELMTKLNNNPQNYQILINRMSDYFRASLYIHFLEKWINIFPREQLLILKSEDMYENPAATTKQVFDFLGLPNYQLLEYKNYYPGSYPPIDANLRREISELFQPHNQKLEEYLGMKFNWD